VRSVGPAVVRPALGWRHNSPLTVHKARLGLNAGVAFYNQFTGFPCGDEEITLISAGLSVGGRVVDKSPGRD